MTIEEQIRERLREIAAEVGPDCTMLAKVVSVDEEKKTCTLLNDDIEIFDVRLKPVLTNNESITLFPKENSFVLAVRVEGTGDWYVIAAEEVTKITMVVGSCNLEIKEGFLIKKGDDTLLQIVKLLVEACQQIFVLQGNNPNYVKLAEALTKANNLLK